MKNQNRKIKRIGDRLSGVSKIMLLTLFLGLMKANVHAATDPLSAINNLSTIMFGIIRAVGMLMTAYGVVHIGLSIKSQDPTQRVQGFLSTVGGLLITFAPEILSIIIGD